MDPDNHADSPESIPTPLRALAGLAATALDESRRFPAHLAGLPVLIASTAFEASLKLQQRYAELVARGDELLANLGPLPDAAPPWARFDDEDDLDDDLDDDFDDDFEDGLDEDDLDDSDDSVDDSVEGGDIPFEGDAADVVRSASGGSAPDRGDGVSAAPADEPAATPPSPAGDPPPDVASPLPGYDEMSIPQLRARLRSLDQARLEALIAHEQRTLARAPYLTMLSNRLETLRSGAPRRRS